MIRFLFVLSGVLFLGITGAFLLFVPVLSIATAALLLTGLILTFCLGMQVGTRELAPSAGVEK